MHPAASDKHRILDILCAAFDTNRSVDRIVGSGPGRERRIRALMDYSYEVCARFGTIYLADDRKACALTLCPDRKRSTAATLLLDLKLVLRCVGLKRLPAVLQREARIKKQHPGTPFTYLWFIGVDPAAQGQGRGSALLQRVLRDSMLARRPVYLETSTAANLPLYQRAGFERFHTADLGYPLHFMRALTD